MHQVIPGSSWFTESYTNPPTHSQARSLPDVFIPLQPLLPVRAVDAWFGNVWFQAGWVGLLLCLMILLWCGHPSTLGTALVFFMSWAVVMGLAATQLSPLIFSYSLSTFEAIYLSIFMLAYAVFSLFQAQFEYQSRTNGLISSNMYWVQCCAEVAFSLTCYALVMCADALPRLRGFAKVAVRLADRSSMSASPLIIS